MAPSSLLSTLMGCPDEKHDATTANKGCVVFYPVGQV